HPVPFTPAQNVVATKARIRPNHDLHLRPTLTNLRHDSFELFHRPFRRTDIGSPQSRAEQMLATKYVQRKVTVRAVVAVKEPPLLTAVDLVIGRVQIENDLLWCRRVCLEEHIHQETIDR